MNPLLRVVSEPVLNVSEGKETWRITLLLDQKLDFTVNNSKRLSLNGIDASFMSDMEKELMKSRLEKKWRKLLDKYN